MQKEATVKQQYISCSPGKNRSWAVCLKHILLCMDILAGRFSIYNVFTYIQLQQPYHYAKYIAIYLDNRSFIEFLTNMHTAGIMHVTYYI